MGLLIIYAETSVAVLLNPQGSRHIFSMTADFSKYSYIYYFHCLSIYFSVSKLYNPQPDLIDE
jgi:hypothetical protein